ncbi:Fic family protein [Actinomadura sp. LOL_016]|uniref:Fic family protein n=1 Tax=unclassified Actinomadura TaxID=2626254 RepID=UPI003A7FE701
MPYRRTDAFAKAGRERYGVRPRADFDAHLAEARAGGAPVTSRAARAYLDVCFFHPFADGNARAALLALVFVLGRDRVVLDHLGPLPVLARWADDPVAAVELVRLLRVLVRQAGRRRVSPSGSP